MGMFTERFIRARNLQTPPVAGCRCTYCKDTAYTGWGCPGHNSSLSHKLPGGNENHNPENKARLALRQYVTKKQFKEYVKAPGGAVLWFQGESGLWYATGRTHNFSGHFVDAFDYKNGSCVATLCLPLKDRGLPLAGIVLTHYLTFKQSEEDAWRICSLHHLDQSHPAIGPLLKAYRASHW